jgi:tricorn protease
MLYNIDDAKITAVTGDRVDSYDPEWSPDGKWLYFLSSRQLQSVVPSPWGPNQPEPFFAKTTRIYMVSLKAGERSPFLPSDELFVAEKQKKEKDEKDSKSKDEEKKDTKKEKEVTVAIDFDGLKDRIFEVPVPAGAYSGLSVNKKALFFVERGENVYEQKNKLTALEIKNKNIKPEVLLEGISSYELTLDGEKLLVQKGEDIYVIEASATAPTKLDEKKVDLKDWTFSVSPRDEWRQMFIEAWRLERDYFYDPKLHGVDYDGLLKKHLPVIDRITDRSELNELTAHIVSELSALHTFVQGGDVRKGQDNISPASLGAKLTRDEQNGGYRIEHIYATDPDYPDKLSPLARPEVGAKEGDIIRSINGVSLISVPDPAVLLRNAAGKQLLVELQSTLKKGTRSVIVKPVPPYTESDLRYDEWEYTRRLAVEAQGKGDIGYVHLRAMGGGNYTEWVKNFYPVFNRKGLIIDVRHNRGGNIDSWILEKLLRKAWFYWKGRVGGPTWNMQYAFRGHMVVLCDEMTASDGEAFTEGFRRLGLGKVIGTRTWGGEIWLSFSTWLVDRGIASAAETGVYSADGQWLIEGHGVDPDIVVDNLPNETFNGKDAQLEAAVKYLQDKIKREPIAVPPPPAYPNKAFEYK